MTVEQGKVVPTQEQSSDTTDRSCETILDHALLGVFMPWPMPGKGIDSLLLSVVRIEVVASLLDVVMVDAVVMTLPPVNEELEVVTPRDLMLVVIVVKILGLVVGKLKPEVEVIRVVNVLVVVELLVVALTLFAGGLSTKPRSTKGVGAAVRFFMEGPVGWKIAVTRVTIVLTERLAIVESEVTVSVSVLAITIGIAVVKVAVKVVIVCVSVKAVSVTVLVKTVIDETLVVTVSVRVLVKEVAVWVSVYTVTVMKLAVAVSVSIAVTDTVAVAATVATFVKVHLDSG